MFNLLQNAALKYGMGRMHWPVVKSIPAVQTISGLENRVKSVIIIFCIPIEFIELTNKHIIITLIIQINTLTYKKLSTILFRPIILSAWFDEHGLLFIFFTKRTHCLATPEIS
jgi:hypothetical protein